MASKSAAVVSFIANLMPLYQSERRGEESCARSLQDGTLILPIAEDDYEEAWVRVYWHGDSQHQSEVLGAAIATLAIERYVRLHSTGASEDTIASELWFMAQHFRFKTGCDVHLPQLPEPAHPAVRAAKRLGEGVLANLLSKLAGA